MAPCKNRQACHTPEHFLVMAAQRAQAILVLLTLVQRIQSCLQGPRSFTDVSQTRVVHPYGREQIPWHDAACMPPAVVAAMDACTATHSCKGELRQARQQQYPALPTDRRSRRATVMSAVTAQSLPVTCDRAVRRCRSRIYAPQIHAVPCPGEEARPVREQSCAHRSHGDALTVPTDGVKKWQVSEATPQPAQRLAVTAEVCCRPVPEAFIPCESPAGAAL
jgi:hypothetical protein